jgi:hypothetical protein
MEAMVDAAQAAALWSGLCLLLLFVLSFLVVRQRQKHKVSIGDGGVPELVQASRAFGNAVEYVPVILAGLAVLAVAGAPAWLVHMIGGMLFVGRVAHAVGLTMSSGVSAGRAAGMMLTWLALLVGGVTLVFFGIG